ncbi:Protein CEPU-1 [Halotydeus destructor]|nr:Protein CEPU-1 [Halotydeus destructor]
MLVPTKGSTVEAEFAKSIPNLSIIRGKDAFMTCSVRNLGVHKDHVISANPRIRIIKDGETWTLVISGVQLEDRGYYSCQISGQAKSQVGFLEVVVPPHFEDKSLKGDTNVTVNEYANVTLSCRAGGNPKPKIQWHREDGQVIRTLSGESDLIFAEELTMVEVTRWSSGAYMCVANSGVSPPISRRIMLLVQFAPMIRIPSQTVAGRHGQDVTLECITESFPLASQRWIDPFGNTISQGSNDFKFRHQVQKTYHFKVIYRLSVLQVDTSDAGSYVCQVRNTLGVTRSGLTLQVVDRTVQLTTSRTLRILRPTEKLLPVAVYQREINDTGLTLTPGSDSSNVRADKKDKSSFQSVLDKAKRVISNSSRPSRPLNIQYLLLVLWLLK